MANLIDAIIKEAAKTQKIQRAGVSIEVNFPSEKSSTSQKGMGNLRSQEYEEYGSWQQGEQWGNAMPASSFPRRMSHASGKIQAVVRKIMNRNAKESELDKEAGIFSRRKRVSQSSVSDIDPFQRRHTHARPWVYEQPYSGSSSPGPGAAMGTLASSGKLKGRPGYAPGVAEQVAGISPIGDKPGYKKALLNEYNEIARRVRAAWNPGTSPASAEFAAPVSGIGVRGNRGRWERIAYSAKSVGSPGAAEAASRGISPIARGGRELYPPKYKNKREYYLTQLKGKAMVTEQKVKNLVSEHPRETAAIAAGGVGLTGYAVAKNIAARRAAKRVEKGIIRRLVAKLV